VNNSPPPGDLRHGGLPGFWQPGNYFFSDGLDMNENNAYFCSIIHVIFLLCWMLNEIRTGNGKLAKPRFPKGFAATRVKPLYKPFAFDGLFSVPLPAKRPARFCFVERMCFFCIYLVMIERIGEVFVVENDQTSPS
jgi:hypothetical protein